MNEPKKLTLLPTQAKKLTYLVIVIPLTTLIPFFTIGLLGVFITIVNKQYGDIFSEMVFPILSGIPMLGLLYAFHKLRKKFRMIPIIQQQGSKIKLQLSSINVGKEYSQGYSELILTFISATDVYTTSITGNPYYIDNYLDKTKDNPPLYPAYVYNYETYMLEDDFYKEFNRHTNDKS